VLRIACCAVGGCVWAGHRQLSRALIGTHISYSTLILDDFGRIGCAWRETNVEDTELESVINDLLEGQYSNPVRVVGFNTAEGWSRDVSEDIARELFQRCADQDRELPDFLQEVVERYQTAKA
jgi:hypothetical protein